MGIIKRGVRLYHCENCSQLNYIICYRSPSKFTPLCEVRSEIFIMSESDSSNELSLSMECLSTSSESSLSTTMDPSGVSVPYLFEPVLSNDDEDFEEDIDLPTDPDHRLSTTSWCSCGHCASLGTVAECRCCQEVAAVREKIEEGPEQLTCITDHPGFAEVCLSVYALETAYYHYRQEHGRGELYAEQIHRKYRYTAYRQLVRWCWRFLGRKVRVPLPACAVIKIRNRFPSAEFAGFKYPQLD